MAKVTLASNVVGGLNDLITVTREEGVEVYGNTLKTLNNVSKGAVYITDPNNIKKVYETGKEFFLGSEKEREFNRKEAEAEAETSMVDAQITLAEKKAKLAKITAKGKES